MKKILPIFIATVMLSLAMAPAAFAVECDQDKDGYIALTEEMARAVVNDGALEINGNYIPEQWAGVFESYKGNVQADAGISPNMVCDSLTFKKGVEPLRCDQITLNSASGVFDTARVRTLSGNKVNPGTFDAPDNGIDEDCDGTDGALIEGNSSGQDLGGLAQKAITLLGRAVAVISIAVLIWGGILYSTAAGDEQKTSKARKAIIGAIIGLIVGLLAPSVVSWVVSSLA